MKKFILLLVVAIFFSTILGYYGKNLFSKKNETIASKNTTKTTQTQNNKKEEIVDTAKETASINALIKSYLVSSMNYDWNTVEKLSTGNYKSNLETKIIPEMKNIIKEKKDIKYEFNPRLIKTNIETLHSKEAVVTVKYIVTRDVDDNSVTSQEEIKLFLVKESDRWLIFSVDVK